MNPPLFINDIEVVSINPMLKTFSLVAHMKVVPLQMYTPEIISEVQRQVQIAVKYLVVEGFISDPKAEPWQMLLTGMCHPPTSSAI